MGVKEQPNPPTGMFKITDTEETEEFKAWSRGHYVPGTAVPDMWHPVIREECEKINKEFYSQVKSRD